jgi:hypothetical protein
MTDTTGDGIVATALKRWAEAYEHERDNIDAAYEDLRFRAARTPADQWGDEALKAREAQNRPVLMINRLPQFLRQVTGDIRMMRPAIKVVPVDDRGDPDTAEVIAGMIRYVENRSDAQSAYFVGADSQVACGIGHWRVVSEYADESTFNQELRIVGIEDGVSVLWDPDAILPTREDARWCIVPVDMSRASFKERFPDAKAESFGDEHLAEGWAGDDFVRVAEYWVKQKLTRTLALMPNGAVDDLTGLDEGELELARAYAAEIGARIEERPGTKVVRYLITAAEVLEGPTDWPGRHIPVVPVIGEEVRVGRHRYRHGCVRYAKDSQRAYNYYASAQTEIVALQPKAPFLVTEKNVKLYEPEWQGANNSNTAYLPYTPDPANGGAPPSRVTPPVSSQGLTEGLLRAADDMKAVIGIYDASLGMRSNETSGRAIHARQREGDIGTYLYIDNFARAVRHTGAILVDLIPKIYDSQRTVRVLGEDGKVDLVKINQPDGLADPDGGGAAYRNDVTVGAYDVVLQMGPSYSTRREEARDGMTSFIQAAPQVAPLVMDLYAQSQDWPNAEKIGKRLKHGLPPQVQAEEAQESGDPKEMQRVMALMQPNGGQPDPAQQAMALQGQIALQKAQLEIATRQQDLQQKQALAEVELELKRLELQRKLAEAAAAGLA